MKTCLYLAAFILLDILIPRTEKGCSCSSHNYLEDDVQSYHAETTEVPAAEADMNETDSELLLEE